MHLANELPTVHCGGAEDVLRFDAADPSPPAAVGRLLNRTRPVPGDGVEGRKFAFEFVEHGLKLMLMSSIRTKSL